MIIKDFSLSLHRKGSEDSTYEISDEDSAGTVQYFGYLNSEGYWVIQKVDRSVTYPTYRYTFGRSAYSTNWTNRASLTYDVYSALFTYP